MRFSNNNFRFDKNRTQNYDYTFETNGDVAFSDSGKMYLVDCNNSCYVREISSDTLGNLYFKDLVTDTPVPFASSSSVESVNKEIGWNEDESFDEYIPFTPTKKLKDFLDLISEKLLENCA